MRSYIMTGPGDPTPLEPRWPGTNLPASQPLPPGSTVDTIPAVMNDGRWNADKALQYLATVGKAYEQAQEAGARVGVTIPQGLDIGTLTAAMGAGAGIGALFGGVGAPIGAIVGLLVGVWQMFAGPRTSGPYGNDEVRRWATRYAPQSFISWAESTGKTGWTSIPQISRDLLLYWLQHMQVVLIDDGVRYYNNEPNIAYINSAGGNDVVAALYEQAGIDYWATRIARQDLNQSTTMFPTIQYAAKVNLPAGSNPPGGNSEGDGESTGTAAAVIGGALVIGGVVYLSRRNRAQQTR